MSEELKKQIDKLHEISVYLKKRCEELTEKDFFTSEEKGSEVGSARQTEQEIDDEIYREIVGLPEKESTKKLKVTEEVIERDEHVIVGNIILSTEKAYLVMREDGLCAWIAKSHLSYTSGDAPEFEFHFKVDRAWAIEKLEWRDDDE